MIRREIQLPDQPPQWLLISQVEHARLSGVLAEHCLLHLDQPLRGELMQAVIHHDDGWAAWECRPGIDAELGRPLSFRELPQEESLAVWTASIEAASEFGPLAGWVTAGHFLALLHYDEPATLEPIAEQWQQTMLARQAKWYKAWQTSSPDQNTQPVADEALLWLQLLDVMSLWLCSVCPGVGELSDAPPAPYLVGEGKLLETEFSFRPATRDHKSAVAIKPWRLDTSDLALEATGWTVPIGSYANADELFAARRYCSIRWNLAEVT